MMEVKPGWLSESISSEKKIWNIGNTEKFIDSLVEGILIEINYNVTKIPDITILLPTKRACKLAQDIFLKSLNKRATLLPRIIPLQNIGEEGMLISSDIKPAISPFSRRLLLIRMILKEMESSGKTQDPEIANQLAKELELFLDEIQTEQISLEKLDDLVPDDLTQYWQRTLKFLNIIRINWPKILSEKNVIDPIDRRNQLSAIIAKSWKLNPPKNLIIAAGTTGTIPSTEHLLGVIKTLPKGIIVLPGFDNDIAEKTWEKLDTSHPQFFLKNLITKLGHDRKKVIEWPINRVHKDRARERFISEVMLPHINTTKKTKSFTSYPNAVKGVSIIEVQNDQKEALIIALAMRSIEHKKNLSAALITPDLQLSLHVSKILKKWNINIEHSTGINFSELPTGIFLRLIAKTIIENYSPISMLSLFKHPMMGNTSGKENFKEIINELELNYLRGKAPYNGIIDFCIKVASDPGCSKELSSWIKSFKRNIKDFHDLSIKKNVSFNRLLRKHIECAEMLAQTKTSNGIDRLWSGEEGEAFSNFISELNLSSEALGNINPIYYQKFLSSLLQEKNLIRKNIDHPRLKILSPIEARLLNYDIAILGGFSEGFWPPHTPNGPWLNKQMRKTLGLPSLEHRSGQTAHDICQALGAQQILISRSHKRNDEPCVPSRWWYRLQLVLDNWEYKENSENPSIFKHLVDWSNKIDKPKDQEYCSPPKPKPSIENRPRSLSVTEIGTLVRNPYEIYVKHILKISPIEKIGVEPDHENFGIFLHQVLEKYISNHHKNTTSLEKRKEALLSLAEKILSLKPFPHWIKTLWLSRLKIISEWFLKKSLSKKVIEIFSEVKGSYTTQTKEGEFTLIGRIDRLELLDQKTLKIIDYKTGTPPSEKNIRNGYEPQLTLLALITIYGNLENIYLQTKELSSIEYWHIHGKKEGGEVKRIRMGMKEIEEQHSLFKEFIEKYQNPNQSYFCQINDKLISRFDKTEHLSRREEWINYL